MKARNNGLFIFGNVFNDELRHILWLLRVVMCLRFTSM